MKKKVLFVCEHPLGTTGNGGMMAGILSQLNKDEYDATLFSCDLPPNNNKKMALEPLPCNIVSAKEDSDMFGKQKLLDFLSQTDCDIVLFVGHDIWQYAPVYEGLKQLQKGGKTFKTGAIFPWDIQAVREDWVKWINNVDFPCVYSQHGLDALKPVAPNIRYYRPMLHSSDSFKELPSDQNLSDKKKMLPGLLQDEILFGFVGVNQIRKDLQRLLKGFSIAVKKNPKIILYLHTDMVSPSRYNLTQYAIDCGIPKENLRAKQQGVTITLEQMVGLLNTLDCLINCSLQEGLSWTPLEAMLCGVPVIASDTTAQTELVKGAGVLVPNTIPTYQPLVGALGQTFIDALACDPEDIAKAILEVAGSEDLRKKMKADGLKKGQEWLDGVSDVNDLLKDMATEQHKLKTQKTMKKDEVLFVQYASAGDVLMTTQCFKGIKERHRGKKLVYMTQSKFAGVVKDNPHLDDIIPWDARAAKDYAIIYNPHGQKILPGNFNSGDAKLYAMYPYFCHIKEPDKMFIAKDKPDIEGLFDEDYIVINTSGASPFRRYKHMGLAVANIGYKVVMVGCSSDLSCDCDFDLRDRLTYTESAYVMDKAVGAIVVDSFCSHLAGAVNTKSVCLFGPAPARVVGPRYDDISRLVELEPNKLDVCPVSSNCYGQPGFNVCDSPCINTLSPLKIKKELLKLIGGNNG